MTLDDEVDRCIQALQAIKLISATHSTASKEGSDRVLDVVNMLLTHKTGSGLAGGLCPAVADGIYRHMFNRELLQKDRPS